MAGDVGDLCVAGLVEFGTHACRDFPPSARLRRVVSMGQSALRGEHPRWGAEPCGVRFETRLGVLTGG